MRLSRTRIAALIVAAALAATAIAGCGFGAGPGTKQASIDVTSNFGQRVIGTAAEKNVPSAETDMNLLQRHFKVKTRYGGGFVESINGHAGTGPKTDWFFYVNGMLAPKGAAETDVHQGDHIWWDLHDWAANNGIPAVVGSFPEPFTNGIGGQEYPTLLDCAKNAQSACDTVGDELRDVGVKAGDQGLGTGSGSDSLAVLVGTWKDLRGVIAAELVNAGPSASGVYAQFHDGTSLQLDNPLGDVAKTLHGSVGLIAATEQASLNVPVWFVTGTDQAAVQRAARDFKTSVLHNHFAVAIDGSKVISLPVTNQSGGS